MDLIRKLSNLEFIHHQKVQHGYQGEIKISIFISDPLSFSSCFFLCKDGSQGNILEGLLNAGRLHCTDCLQPREEDWFKPKCKACNFTIKVNITCPIKHTVAKIHIAIVTKNPAPEIPGDDIYEVTRAEFKLSTFLPNTILHRV